MKKSTHTIQDIENWMREIVAQIQNAETKTEKHALLKKLKGLETHYNNCKDKETDGKGYVKKPIKETPKKELLALIDSVETDIPKQFHTITDDSVRININNKLDVSGVFPPFTKQ